MTYPTLQVLIDTPSAAPGLGYLVVGTGVVGTDKVAPNAIYVDDGSSCRSLQTNRGSSDPTDALFHADTGTCSFVLDNLTRTFDPLATDDVKPNRAMKVVATWNAVDYDVFNGAVDSWRLNYPGQGRDATTAVAAFDLRKSLVDASVDALDRQMSGARINFLLDIAGWPQDARDIADGFTLMPAHVGTVSNAAAADEAADSEWGETYVAADGTYVFRDRQALATELRSSVSQATFGDGEQTLSTDTFNRGNNASSLGSTDGTGDLDPQAWTNVVGTLGINTNQAAPNGALAHGVSTVDLGTADCTLQVTLSKATANAGISFRVDDANNFLYVYTAGPGGSNVVTTKVVGGGGPSTIGTTTTTVSDGDVLQVVLNGSLITVALNGVTLHSVTESFNQNETKHGLYLANGTTPRLDNWSATSGTELPYSDIEISYDTTRIRNDVTVTYNENGDTARASDGTSIRDFGRHQYALQVSMADAPTAQNYANWLVQLYKDPYVRVDSLTIKPRHSPDTLFPQVFGREIGDRITVKLTPPGGGSRITRDGFIRGIEHSAVAVAQDWTTTFTLQDATNIPTPFIVGTSTVGGTDVVWF